MGWSPKIRVELVEELEELFLASVKRRLRSDVPVGIFLSGGLDSSLVAAAAAACQSDVRTFTVRFPGSVVDETPYATRISEHLGTQHETIDGLDIELVGSDSQLFQSFSSPILDSSILPTFAISKFTRQFVTVALGGDGGDELLVVIGLMRSQRFVRNTLHICQIWLSNWPLLAWADY